MPVLYYLLFVSLIFDSRLAVGSIPLYFLSVFPAIAYVFTESKRNKVLWSPVIQSSIIFSLILFCYVAFAVALSGKFSIVAQLVTHFFIPIGAILIGRNFKGKEQQLKKAIWVFYIPLLFAIAQMLNMYYDIAGPFSIFTKIRDWDYQIQQSFSDTYIVSSRAIGTFVNPNTLGYFFALIFWFLFLMFNKFNYHHFFCVAGVLLSGSRGSLLALIFSVMLVYFLRRKQVLTSKQFTRLAFNFLLVVTICIYYLYNFKSDEYEFLSRFSEIGSIFEGGKEKSENLSGRISAWDSIVSYVDTHPLGTILPPQTVINESPDSQFFYFLAQGGWLLAFAYIIHISTIFIWSLFAVNERYILLGASIIVGANGLSMATLNSPIAFFFYFIIGYISSVRLRDQFFSNQ